MGIWESLSAKFSGAGAAKSQKRDPAELERNSVRRRQRMMDGFIWSEGMISPRACTIRDMSATGAQVVLWESNVKANLLKGTVKLYSSGDRKEVDCTVVRREGDTLGLRLTSGFREPTRKYG
jgi:hypothetical protein